MVLSGHQPCYLPSLQLFAKIRASDLFIHCGHLQFEHGSWHNRNYILLGGKRHRLTIPIQRPHLKPISETWFGDQTWKKKHLKTIELAYGKAPFFKAYYPVLKEIIYSHPHSLERLNIELSNELANWLGVTTPMVDGGKWKFSGDAVDMIIQMCHEVGADAYLSNAGSKAYIFGAEEERMLKAGVRPEWLVFVDPCPAGEEPLSAVHHLFHLGPETARLIE